MQQLYRRFVILIPWLERCTNARVRVTKFLGQPGFSVEAEWSEGGRVEQYRKVYSPEGLRNERYGCTKDLARKFIRETLEKRGV